VHRWLAFGSFFIPRAIATCDRFKHVQDIPLETPSNGR
jgi:hypothetical protein